MAHGIQTRNHMVCRWFRIRRYNTMKNKTLTKNMPYVKWNAIPPVKGPDSQGVTYGNNKKNTSVRKKPLGKNKRVL